MKNRISIALALCCFVSIVLNSCKKERDITPQQKEGQLVINLSNISSERKNASVASIDSFTSAALTSVVVTIEDPNGKVIKESEKIDLYNMNGSYISKPISLTNGNYKLTRFLILDWKNNVVYASPLAGSVKAYLVTNPLPLSFEVQMNVVTKITPEVLNAGGSKPEDFGYSTFNFAVAQTFDFLVGVFTYQDSIKNYKLTSSNIAIYTDTIKILSGQLIASPTNLLVNMYDSIGLTNKITLPERYSNYKLEISKSGYKTYTKTFTKDSLKLYFRSLDKGPLVVILEKDVYYGTVVYYPFNGNAKNQLGTGYDGTVNGATLTTDRKGNANSAYNFNGTNGFISVAKFGDKIPTGEISVSLWARTDIMKSTATLSLGIENNSLFGTATDYNHNSANSIFWDFGWKGDGGDAQGRLYKIGVPFDQNWHHYVFISSIKESIMKIYKDGVLLVQKTQPLSLKNSAGLDMNIGRTVGGVYYQGAIDDIRILNRVLTDAEITNLYNE